MSRRSTIAFFALIVAVLLVVYLLRPQPLVTADGNSDVQETIAAGIVALASALTPTVTAYVSSTPTKTPKPSTETPLPTYGPDASPGVWMVPAWTEVPPIPETQEAGLPPCATVTPEPYSDIACEVRQ